VHRLEDRQQHLIGELAGRAIHVELRMRAEEDGWKDKRKKNIKSTSSKFESIANILSVARDNYHLRRMFVNDANWE
jgi:hypothetical protein